jgi:hypothetical protein
VNYLPLSCSFVFCFCVSADKCEDDDEEEEETDGKENLPDDVKSSGKRLKVCTNTMDVNTFLYHHRQAWLPNHSMLLWENDLLRKMITVVVSLDGGVDLQKDVKVWVSDQGNELMVKQKWPDKMANVDKLHNVFRKKDPTAYPSYHPKIISFQRYMKNIKREENDCVYNTCCIKLPFLVQADIVEQHRLGDAFGTRLLYVDLRALQCDTFIVGAEANDMLMMD